MQNGSCLAHLALISTLIGLLTSYFTVQTASARPHVSIPSERYHRDTQAQNGPANSRDLATTPTAAGETGGVGEGRGESVKSVLVAPPQHPPSTTLPSVRVL